MWATATPTQNRNLHNLGINLLASQEAEDHPAVKDALAQSEQRDWGAYTATQNMTYSDTVRTALSTALRDHLGANHPAELRKKYLDPYLRDEPPQPAPM